MSQQATLEFNKYIELEQKHLVRIQEITSQTDPESNPEIEEGEWCYNAVNEISQYLVKENIKHLVRKPPCKFSLEDIGECPHSWIEFEDQSILDPTISQFIDYGLDSWPHLKGFYDIAFISPEDELHGSYISN